MGFGQLNMRIFKSLKFQILFDFKVSTKKMAVCLSTLRTVFTNVLDIDLRLRKLDSK